MSRRETVITAIMILVDHGDHGTGRHIICYMLPAELTLARSTGYNAGMSDLTSTIASLQHRVEEIAVHL